uniref:DDE-1 domain-containing protein n=1 Tax=Glossina palpalis gambiensis TaxID=67801 RepID=A0A1B0BTX8_9MUSC
MREEWNKWMTKPNNDVRPTARMKRPTIPDVCTWMKNSWEAAKEERIMKSFKICGISNVVDCTEDDKKQKLVIPNSNLPFNDNNPEAQVTPEETADQGIEPKTKRMKLPSTNLLVTLLAMLLILPMVFPTRTTNQEFGSKLGINFEEIGSSTISTSQWNIIVYYDLSSSWSDS